MEITKGTRLDGDNLESAMKFLNEIDHHSLNVVPSLHPVDKEMSHGPNIHTLLSEEKHNMLDVGEEEFNFDKNEESIVWKGGFQKKYIYGGAIDPCLMSNDLQMEEGYAKSLKSFESVVFEDNSVDCNMKAQGDRYNSRFCTLPVHEEPSVTLYGSNGMLKQLHASNIRNICQSSGSSTESLALVQEELHTSDSSVDNCTHNFFSLKQTEDKKTVEVQIGMQQCQKECQIDPNVVDNIEKQHCSTALNEEGSETGDTNTSVCEKVDEKSTPQECTFEKGSSETDIIHLEEIDKLVDEARYCKECMKKDMEELHLLRFKAEQEEFEAQHAKLEAENGGTEILLKVEELKTQLSCQRAENELRAAEIHGEKYVLMMEARELKLRLIETKAQQTRALAAINDIREILVEKLEKASQEKSSAVEETLRKMEEAEELLAIEKISLHRVQNDSQVLQTQAEMCTRLKNLLIDRGIIINSLQGEMTILSEDVLTFRKEVDQGIPMSSNLSLRTSSLSHLTKERFLITPLRSLKYIEGSENWAHVQIVEELSPNLLPIIDDISRSQYFSPMVSVIETSDSDGPPHKFRVTLSSEEVTKVMNKNNSDGDMSIVHSVSEDWETL